MNRIEVPLMGMEAKLLGFCLFAIIILSAVSVNLLSQVDQNEVEIVYFETIIDNRQNITVEAEETSYNRSEVARVATFNIQIFGKTKMSKPAVVEELVDIFQRYDLVAVQEIKDIEQNVPWDFLAALNNESGDQWNMVLSDRSGQQEDDESSQEQYAFYYKKSVFIPRDNGTLYNDSASDSFQREPHIANFELLDLEGNSTGLDLNLINIHTKPSLAVEEMNSLGDVLNWSENYYNETDQIILGDFNADCSYASYNELINLTISSEEFIWLVPDNADTTVGDSRCAYDRIVTSSDLDGRLSGNWGIDFAVNNGNVSDHRPVWFDIIRI